MWAGPPPPPSKGKFRWSILHRTSGCMWAIYATPPRRNQASWSKACLSDCVSTRAQPSETCLSNGKARPVSLDFPLPISTTHPQHDYVHGRTAAAAETPQQQLAACRPGTGSVILDLLKIWKPKPHRRRRISWFTHTHVHCKCGRGHSRAVGNLGLSAITTGSPIIPSLYNHKLLS